MRGACVTSVLCTRVLVCKAQSSERGRGSGEAKPGARHASLCANSVATERNACLYRDLFARRRRRAGAFCAVRCPASALLHAASCCSVLLSVPRCTHRCGMGRKPMSAFAKAKKLQNRMEASLPSALLEEIGNTICVADDLRGPMESCAMGDASTEGDSATGSASTSAPCKYTRENVRGRWLEMRYRLQASGVDAPLPLKCPSLTIPKTALATMVVLLPCSGEEVLKRGPPKYADFAKSVPPQNPFTPASAHGGTSQSISVHDNSTHGDTSQSISVHDNSTHSHHYYEPPAAAPAAAAPPSSVAKQLADVKSMFEQGLIPSREIYENKVRQILGLS